MKSAENLDEKQLFYDRHLRKQLTQLERVEEGLAVSPELKASYESMQNIMKSLKDHDKDGIVDYLYNTQNLSRQMKEIFRTFKKIGK